MEGGNFHRLLPICLFVMEKQADKLYLHQGTGGDMGT
jgi:hypothetical protein